jgi:Xaa-Pro aminopeptidase
LSKTIERSEFEQRQQRALAIAAEHGWSGLLVIGRAFYDRCGHLAYLSGHFPPFPASVFSGDWRGIGHSLLVLPAEGAPVLLVDGFYREDLVAVADVRRDHNLVAGLARLLHEFGLAEAMLGLGGEDILPYAFFRELSAQCPQLRVEPADAPLNRLRRRKSPAEQALLRRSASVAAAGLQAAIEAARPGRSEREVCAAGTAAALEAGADFVRYLRVHTGPWSARGSRWPPATDRTIEPGDTVFLDIIGAVDGYQFDVLRTTVAGTPSDEQRRLFEAVHQTVETLVREVRPGMTAGKVAHRCAELLREAAYGQHASPFAGHGIGLETVEEPYLVPEDQTVLEPDMVLCIEPKVAVSDWAGCSIEQEVVLHDREAELLTTFPTRWW